MNLFTDMSLGKKLVCVVICLLIPALFLLYRTIEVQHRTIITTEGILQGSEYMHALAKLSLAVADHRAIVHRYLRVGKSQLSAMTQSEAEVDAAIASVDKLELDVDPALRSGAVWHEASEAWRALKQAELGFRMEDNQRWHNTLLDELDAMSTRVSDQSKLVLDADEVSHYLIDAMLRVPTAQTDLFMLRRTAALASDADNIVYGPYGSHSARATVAVSVSKVRENAAAIVKEIAKLIKLDPAYESELHRLADAHLADAEAIAQMVQGAVVEAEHPQFDNSVGFARAAQAYKSLGQIQDVLVVLLRQRMQLRLAAAVWERNSLLIGYALVLLITLSISRRLRLYITHSAQRLVTTIERLANGQIGEPVPTTSNDEFGRVLIAVNRLDGKLFEVVALMQNTADTVGMAAKELANGNEDLSARTLRHASSIEDTATRMEQMTATVKQNADNALQADHLVAGVREQAERGGTVVDRAVSAMGAINSSSRRIADIIGVIDEIAFQTNLLALNAAVEAARAGAQGLGFAVVASEVRNLAQRSASAAREIKELINDSVEKVKTGTALVTESGKALADIMENVRKTSDVVTGIAAASREQSAGIAQVNHAIAQMDNGTQENASLVAQSAVASKTIHSTVNRLVEEIAFFKVRNQVPVNREAATVETSVGVRAQAHASADVTASIRSRPRQPQMRVARGSPSG